MEYFNWFMDFERRMTQGYQLDHSLSQRLLKHVCDNVLLEHVGLIHVLPLDVHLFLFVLSRKRGSFYSLSFLLDPPPNIEQIFKIKIHIILISPKNR